MALCTRRKDEARDFLIGLPAPRLVHFRWRLNISVAAQTESETDSRRACTLDLLVVLDLVIKVQWEGLNRS